MKPNLPSRQSLRLKDYDYSLPGLYFITICSDRRIPLFGQIADDQMSLNGAGEMIAKRWMELPLRYPKIELHEFIVMPNHLHGILQINPMVKIVGASLVGALGISTENSEPPVSTSAPVVTIGQIVGAFKSLTTNDYVQGVRDNGWPKFNKKIWQRNFYEHVIRNEKSYLSIAEYIQTNPQRWLDDIYCVL
ncbi:transposase [Solimicrobium silvestre]|uniref:Transposase IS200-like domain-containing protein n=1 Tax=Solimicrobium silvestre TaxID=2099400 RepID=A0A2S9GTI5_9BURK|nr:transposase [Solimicrobium silvestre]PRC91027.1 hypothetical protein S2091_4323 [Solimicrobium silvestre]